MTVEEMRQHVMGLLEKHCIRYEWCRRTTQARAIYEAEEVRIAPIKSAISYAVALHEIGHIRGRHQLSPRCMVRERAAWSWAKRNAMIWTRTMEQCRDQSLEFYISSGNARKSDLNWQPATFTIGDGLDVKLRKAK